MDVLKSVRHIDGETGTDLAQRHHGPAPAERIRVVHQQRKRYRVRSGIAVRRIEIQPVSYPGRGKIRSNAETEFGPESHQRKAGVVNYAKTGWRDLVLGCAPELARSNSRSAGPKPPVLKKMLYEMVFGLAETALSLFGAATRLGVREPVENPGKVKLLIS